jgi:hypothetical protein
MATQFGWILSQGVCQSNPGDAIRQARHFGQSPEPRQNAIVLSGWHKLAGLHADIQINE